MAIKRLSTDANIREQLARRIKLRREELNLTQGQLAQRTGLGVAQTISSIERGERDIKATELAVIAKALHYSLSDLFADEAPSQPVVAWRERPDGEAEDLAAQFLSLCESYHAVEIWTQEEQECDLPTIRPPQAWPTLAWARSKAKLVGDTLDLGSLPAVSLYETLEERCGVKIFFFPDLVGSAACTRGDFGAAVALNASQVPWRRSFSLAHELFHLVTWDYLGPEQTGKGGVWSGHVERLANAFASSLLLPETALRASLGEHREEHSITWRGLVEVAREFSVSTEALVWRLVSLDMIGDKEGRALLDDPEFRRIDRETFAPAQTPDLLPRRFVRLLETAYLQGQVSAGRIAELTGKSLARVHHWLSQLEEDEISAGQLVRLA